MGKAALVKFASLALKAALVSGAGRLARYRCPRCTLAQGEEIDPDIYRVFTGRSQLGLGDPRVMLADPGGRRNFEAALSDTDQLSTFAERLKAVKSAHQ